MQALFFAWYNLCRKHESLTPAMASGLSDHAWTISGGSMNYHQTQQAVGQILYLIVGIVALAAVMLFVGILAVELTKRPRYSVRTLLIAMTVLAILLGIGAISHR
jgi:hypothetical protein